MGTDSADLVTVGRIQRFRREDSPAVNEIASESPEVADWSERAYGDSLSWGGILALVSKRDGQVLGFLIGRQIGDEAEILNLAVRQGNRRKGEGGALVIAALTELANHQVSRVYLEVRESNATGIAFYEKHGFAKTGRRSGYYRDPDDAAVLMEKKLTG